MLSDSSKGVESNMAKNEMTPQEAVLVLRMIDGILMTGTMTREMGPEMKALYGKIHEAVDLASTALIIMGDTSVEIDKGGNDD